jgi:hypothetical protein
MKPISESEPSKDEATLNALVAPLADSPWPSDAPWKRLYEYWRSKHKHGRPPARRDLDPLIEIPQIVGNLIILDVLPDGYRFRLVGSEHSRRLGYEMTGRRVGTMGDLPSQIKSGWIAGYDLVKQDRKPRMIISRIRAGASAKHVLIVMPLIDANDTVDCLLVGAFYEGDFKQGSVIEGLIIQEVQI